MPALLSSPAFKKYSIIDSSGPDSRQRRPSRFSPKRQTIKGLQELEKPTEEETSHEDFRGLQFPNVLRELKLIESCTSPATLLGILGRVFSKINALSSLGAISPSDRFLIMTYAVIRCDVKHMYSISRFLIDFTMEFSQNDRSDIQLCELMDVLDYVSTLDWNIRDQQHVLIPHNMIINSVVIASKTLDALKLPEGEHNEVRTTIQLTLSSIFRKLGQQESHTIYQPYVLPPAVCKLLHEHSPYFKSVIEAKGTGLKLVIGEPKLTMTQAGRAPIYAPSYAIHFEVKLPLFVYLKLSDIVITLESESFV